MSLRATCLRPGAAFEPVALCRECLSRVFSPTSPVSRRTYAATSSLRSDLAQARALPRILRKAYFSSHPPTLRGVLATKLLPWSKVATSATRRASLFDSAAPVSRDRGDTVAAQDQNVSELINELPHRRRQRLKSKSENEQASSPETTIRPDASSRLSTLSSTLPKSSLRRQLALYLSLTKPQLSFLIVLTATTSYGLFPTPTLLALDPSITPLPTLSTSTLTCLYLTVGTFLSSASANTLNMLFEPKYDAQMSRTRNRPLVRGLISSRAAWLFAIGTATAGITALYFGTNPTVAALSASNVFLYAFVYTPMKRLSVINTWVGAIVGGIPPLMGWAAAAGQTATTGHDTWRDLLFGPDSLGGWLLAGILFAWQFPHFNALSHTIKDEYRNAGYKMLAWTNPARNGRVALRYSILMFPLCAGLCWAGIVNKGFLVGGTLINFWLTKEAYRFWKLQGAKGTARGMFWASVWHLPLLLVGALVTKTGVWDGVWNRAMGIMGDEEDEEEYLIDEGFLEYEEIRNSAPSSQSAEPVG
ncbi:Protoheme IX farnesyltransferase, mitochondrial [Ophidiomyces ophidiicola]|nr:Protoheme IX farnesyltransferase, mitochondrial [Ophidiomyces ophidiicola]KAI2015617.1 Protoheme IX farnesyltransferase, mitochondrial [Ophidiomyces ophidiicola]KAI2021069.1 Protoheme IX farnesyltransferase, mitochondrial [Ophidiomyces ophidiicola]KAI2059837.1 Protoheme IX farnesyltransferase, mitochondrial [Ophidiomyces ophidiicola]KAI2148999.1 Protoheme IX farnesyltransferase, mitochondrial [Ophidiomyces ophidiicola]